MVRNSGQAIPGLFNEVVNERFLKFETICWLSCPFLLSVGSISGRNTILVNAGKKEDPKERLSDFYHFDAPSAVF